MKSMTRIIILSFALLLLSHCIKERYDKGKDMGNEKISVRFRVDDSPESKSISGLDENSDYILENLNIYAFRENGIYENSVFVDSHGLEDISLTLTKGEKYYFFALGNCGKMQVPKSIEEAKKLTLKINSISELSVGIPSSCISTLLKIQSDNETVNLDLSPLFARLRFNIDQSELIYGRLAISNIKIFNCNSVLFPFDREKNKPGSVIDGDETLLDDLNSVSSGEELVMYVPENRMGDLLQDNTNPWNKIPVRNEEKGKCTYIQIKGRYNSDGLEMGDITYKFYLGKDNCKNFDIIGGTDYDLTLVLTPEGSFIKDSWKVKQGDNWNDPRKIRFSTDATIRTLRCYDNIVDILDCDNYQLKIINDMEEAKKAGWELGLEKKAGENWKLKIRADLNVELDKEYQIKISTWDSQNIDSINVVAYAQPPISTHFKFQNKNLYMAMRDTIYLENLEYFENNISGSLSETSIISKDKNLSIKKLSNNSFEFCTFRSGDYNLIFKSEYGRQAECKLTIKPLFIDLYLNRDYGNKSSMSGPVPELEWNTDENIEVSADFSQSQYFKYKFEPASPQLKKVLLDGSTYTFRYRILTEKNSQMINAQLDKDLVSELFTFTVEPTEDASLFFEKQEEKENEAKLVVQRIPAYTILSKVKCPKTIFYAARLRNGVKDASDYLTKGKKIGFRLVSKSDKIIDRDFEFMLTPENSIAQESDGIKVYVNNLTNLQSKGRIDLSYFHLTGNNLKYKESISVRFPLHSNYPNKAIAISSDRDDISYSLSDNDFMRLTSRDKPNNYSFRETPVFASLINWRSHDTLGKTPIGKICYYMYFVMGGRPEIDKEDDRIIVYPSFGNFENSPLGKYISSHFKEYDAHVIEPEYHTMNNFYFSENSIRILYAKDHPEFRMMDDNQAQLSDITFYEEYNTTHNFQNPIYRVNHYSSNARSAEDFMNRNPVYLMFNIDGCISWRFEGKYRCGFGINGLSAENKFYGTLLRYSDVYPDSGGWIRD